MKLSSKQVKNIQQLLKPVNITLALISRAYGEEAVKGLDDGNISDERLVKSSIIKFVRELALSKHKEKKAKDASKKEESIKVWYERAWKVFSLYIRKRDKYKCVTCGVALGDLYKGKILKPKDFHAGHWIEKSLLGKYHPLNFDPRNVSCQCLVAGEIETGRGKFDISEVIAGDIIKTLDEGTLREVSAKVTSATSFIPETLYEVVLEDGRIFECTHDHKLFCNGRWEDVENIEMLLHSAGVDGVAIKARHEKI